jgi:hypothetical protein
MGEAVSQDEERISEAAMGGGQRSVLGVNERICAVNARAHSAPKPTAC